VISILPLPAFLALAAAVTAVSPGPIPSVTSTSAVSNPVVTFASPGSKSVTLKVCNSAGCSTVTKTVTVLDPAPAISSVSGPSTAGTANGSITFTASGVGRPPLSYNWTLGLPDGTSQTAAGPSFTWTPQIVGAHQLGLKLTSLYGSASANRTVSVVPTVFSDIPPDFWAASFIETLYYAGFTGGCGSDASGHSSFCPADDVIRAELAVFLGRARHPVPFVPPPATGIFADVPPDYWAAPWIEQAYRDGLTGGCSADAGRLSFCPSDAATRAEIAVLLERAVHPAPFTPPPPTGIFADVPVDYWAAPWIEQLYRDGVTAGCQVSGPLRFFCPSPPLTRAEMAVFLVNAFHLEETPTPLVFLARLCSSASSCSYPVGMPIEFDVQLKGGIPASYEYDWNGDGTYEEASVFPLAHTYSEPGTFTPRLRLRRGSWPAVLTHPFPITVHSAVTTSPGPPTGLSSSVVATIAPTATDPPGTPLRLAYSLSVVDPPGALGYAAFVNAGASYQFAGLLAPHRATATDHLLLPTAAAGTSRFLYVRAFSSTGYGPSSLPILLP
jgi:PKD repeat protein